MSGVNADLATESFQRAMRYLEGCDVDVPKSVLNRLCKSVTTLFPQGGESAAPAFGNAAAGLIKRLDAILKKVALQAQAKMDLEHVFAQQGAVLSPLVEGYYLEHSGCAHEHGVVIAEQNGELKIARPSTSINPLDMSAFNPRNMSAGMKKEVLEFFMQNPELASREGLHIQEIAPNEYLLRQEPTFGRNAQTARMSLDPRTNTFMAQDMRKNQELDPTREPAFRPKMQ